MNYPVFLHIEATPNPSEQMAVQQFWTQAWSLILGYGGVKIAKYDVEKAYDQTPTPEAIWVLSFPSRRAIESLFSDQGYQSIEPLAKLGFNHLRFYMTSERISLPS